MESHFALCFPGRAEKELATLGAPLTLLGNVQTRYPWQIWQVRRRFRALLKKECFDVVICHAAWSQALFGKVVVDAQLPLVFWLHDPPGTKLHWLERWAQTCPPSFSICNSFYTWRKYPFLYAHARAEVLYCPVSLPPRGSAEDAAQARVELRAKFGVSPNKVVVLQVGRLEPHKGHLLHLQALGQLRDLPEWECWQLAGVQRPRELQYRQKMEQMAHDLGIGERVRFLDWQPDVRGLFAAADIYCQPNIRPEPFGLTYIEALWAGLPAVATPLGGPSEIIDDSCGFLSPPEDVSGLAGKLRLLVTDASLRRRLGEAGPARASLLCEPARQLTRLRDLLSAALPASH